MPKMRAINTAVTVMEKGGIITAFGVPNAAINPLYSALHKTDSIGHMLARHVEDVLHMAEGYTRVGPGNIGVCIDASDPAGTDMITSLYSTWADLIPTLCIAGQIPHARLYREDFRTVDIESITKPVAKWVVTVCKPALMPCVFQQAFHLVRSGYPGPMLIDLPSDIQVVEIEFDPDMYSPLPVYKPATTYAQAERAIKMLRRVECPLPVYGGGVINVDAAKLIVESTELVNMSVVPTPMGWGVLADDHPLDAGMIDLRTSYRCSSATLLVSDFMFGISNRWANRHTDSVDVYIRGCRFIHIDIKPTQIDRIFGLDLGIASDVKVVLERLIGVACGLKATGKLSCRKSQNTDAQKRKHTMLRHSDFSNMSIKPQCVYREMDQYFPQKGENSVCYVSTVGLPQITTAQFLSVNQPCHWTNCGQTGLLGWTIPAAADVKVASLNGDVVAISGDYSFQFMVEGMVVVAQSKVPYTHVVVNSSYPGLIRQARHNFNTDYYVQLAFDNVNTSEPNGYGVDHVKVVGGLGCKAIRVFKPEDIESAFAQAYLLMAEFSVPVVVEVILEYATNVAMGTEIDNVIKLEDMLDPGDTLTGTEGVTA